MRNWNRGGNKFSMQFLDADVKRPASVRTIVGNGRCKILMKVKTKEEEGTTRIDGARDADRTAQEEVSNKEEDGGDEYEAQEEARA